MTGSPLEFLTLRIIHTEPQQFVKYGSSFPAWSGSLAVSTPEFLLSGRL